MEENIEYLKQEFIITEKYELWKKLFVFDWPQFQKANSSEPNMFKYTFCGDREKINKRLNPWLERHVLSERIKEEITISIKKKSKYNPGSKLDLGTFTSFVKEKPDTGRNEPCPCGSGKKNKKCCGLNS